jgi:hypothetical protein
MTRLNSRLQDMRIAGNYGKMKKFVVGRLRHGKKLDVSGK